ncbi:MAG: mandelate racemase [Gammaproteobacteria bacterium]|nr:mandelate racemase [Gammaproteobacteria bacterium]
MTRPQLTIRALRTRAVSPPMHRPLGTSATRMERAPFVLVELETEEGVTGRAHAYCYLERAAPLLRDVLTTAGEAIVGAAVDPGAIRSSLDATFRLLGAHGLVAMGLSALDVACWDALAVAADVSLARFLESRADTVPAYNSNGLSIARPEALGAEARDLLEPGFGALKIRLGRSDAAEDLAAVQAVRAAVSGDTLLMADYNQSLTVTDAISRGAQLEQEDLYWIEEPVSADDLSGCAQVSAALTMPVQIGENLYGPQGVETAIALKASDFLMFDLMRIGGVSGWLEAAASASRAGIPVSSHLYPEVSAHLLAATETAHWLEYVDWAEPFLETGIEVVDGEARVPDRPGTGVVWDEEAVARYAMS